MGDSWLEQVTGLDLAPKPAAPAAGAWAAAVAPAAFGLDPQESRQAFDLEQERRRVAAEPETWAGFFARRAIPLASNLTDVGNRQEVQNARDRLSRGAATPEDLHRIAWTEHQQKIEADRSTLGKIGSGLARVPAVVGEFAIAAPFGAAASAGRVGLAARAANLAGTTAALPGFYLPMAQAQAEKTNTRLYEPQNLAPAVAYTAATTAVLGRLAGAAPAGRGFVANVAGKTAQGLGEQTLVDVASTAADRAMGGGTGLDTGWGPLAQLATGTDEGLAHFATTALTFATLAAMHAPPQLPRRRGLTKPPPEPPNPVVDAVSGAVEAQTQKGVPEAVTYGRMADIAERFDRLLRESPETAWEDARELWRQEKEIEFQRFAKAMADAIPKPSEPAPDAGLPPVPPGHVRLFHGGYEAPGGKRPAWVSTDPVYARDFRNEGRDKKLFYIDVPEGHPELAGRKVFEDEGSSVKSPIGHFEMSPGLAGGMKEVPAPGEGRTVRPPQAPEPVRPAAPEAPEHPRVRLDRLTAERDRADERLADATRAVRAAKERAGVLYPDDAAGREAKARAEREHADAQREFKAARKERANIQRGLDAVRDELMRLPAEQQVPPGTPPAAQDWMPRTVPTPGFEVRPPERPQAQAADWLRSNIADLHAEAVRLGVAGDIAELSARRMTAGEVANALRAKLGADAPPDLKDIVRGVRAHTGIPSLDEPAAYEAWRSKYLAGKSPVEPDAGDMSPPRGANGSPPSEPPARGAVLVEQMRQAQAKRGLTRAPAPVEVPREARTVAQMTRERAERALDDLVANTDAVSPLDAHVVRQMLRGVSVRDIAKDPETVRLNGGKALSRMKPWRRVGAVLDRLGVTRDQLKQIAAESRAGEPGRSVVRAGEAEPLPPEGAVTVATKAKAEARQAKREEADQLDMVKGNRPLHEAMSEFNAKFDALAKKGDRAAQARLVASFTRRYPKLAGIKRERVKKEPPAKADQDALHRLARRWERATGRFDRRRIRSVKSFTREWLRALFPPGPRPRPNADLGDTIHANVNIYSVFREHGPVKVDTAFLSHWGSRKEAIDNGVPAEFIATNTERHRFSTSMDELAKTLVGSGQMSVGKGEKDTDTLARLMAGAKEQVKKLREYEEGGRPEWQRRKMTDEELLDLFHQNVREMEDARQRLEAAAREEAGRWLGGERDVQRDFDEALDDGHAAADVIEGDAAAGDAAERGDTSFEFGANEPAEPPMKDPLYTERQGNLFGPPTPVKRPARGGQTMEMFGPEHNPAADTAKAEAEFNDLAAKVQASGALEPEPLPAGERGIEALKAFLPGEIDARMAAAGRFPMVRIPDLLDAARERFGRFDKAQLHEALLRLWREGRYNITAIADRSKGGDRLDDGIKGLGETLFYVEPKERAEPSGGANRLPPIDPPTANRVLEMADWKPEPAGGRPELDALLRKLDGGQAVSRGELLAVLTKYAAGEADMRVVEGANRSPPSDPFAPPGGSAHAAFIFPPLPPAVQRWVNWFLGTGNPREAPVRIDRTHVLPRFQASRRAYTRIFSAARGMARVPGLARLMEPGRTGEADVAAITARQGAVNMGHQIGLEFAARLRAAKTIFPVDATGTFPLADGTRGHLADVIEAEMLTPGSQKLTQDQKAWVHFVWTPILRDAQAMMRDEGVNRYVDANGDPVNAKAKAYFPRPAIGKEGMAAPSGPGQPPGGPKMPGSKAGFQRRRTFGSEADGAAGRRSDGTTGDKIVYDPDPASRVGKFVADVYRVAADRRLARDPALGGVPMTRRYRRWLKRTQAFAGPLFAPKIIQLSDGRLIAHGRLFPVETARKLEGVFNERMPGLLRRAGEASDVFKAATLTADFSVPFVQGLPVLAASPRAWGKGVLGMVRAFADPEFVARYSSDPANRRYVDAFTQAGGSPHRIADQFRGLEPGTLLTRLPVVGRAYEAFGRSQAAFQTVAKVELWKAWEAVAKPNELAPLAEAIENLTGAARMEEAGLSPARAAVERLLALAPMYYRSAPALIATAAGRGLPAKVVRTALARMAGGVVLSAVGAMYALGLSWDEIGERLNPARGKFLKVPVTLGDGSKVEFGVSSVFLSLVRLVGDTAEFAAGDQPITSGSDFNPLVRWARGHAGSLPRLAADITTGKDFMGERISPQRAVGQNLVPVAAQKALFDQSTGYQKSADAAISFLGFGSFPANPHDEYLQAVKARAQADFGRTYSELSLSDQARVVRAVRRTSAVPKGTPSARVAELAQAADVERQRRVNARLTPETRAKLAAWRHPAPGYEGSVHLGGVPVPLDAARKKEYEGLLAEEYERTVSRVPADRVAALPQAQRDTVLRSLFTRAKERARARLLLADRTAAR